MSRLGLEGTAPLQPVPWRYGHRPHKIPSFLPVWCGGVHPLTSPLIPLPPTEAPLSCWLATHRHVPHRTCPTIGWGSRLLT